MYTNLFMMVSWHSEVAITMLYEFTIFTIDSLANFTTFSNTRIRASPKINTLSPITTDVY